MSEMDMDIKHGALEDANAQMKQVAATMNSALETIVQRLDAIRSEFTGEAAKEFAEFKQAVNSLDSSLSQQFNQGADLLSDAHGIIRNGDRKSAYLFQR
ncbi:WXG100 family type VII secretion target [Streptomyces sp. NPDC093249]|uniref:WXG100 family type VII secretion target n=1 Tax=unclassified Streptomyces TaxID=2593676 RepID=UPI00344FE867